MTVRRRGAKGCYGVRVGRLENIIARNRRPVGFRATVGLVWRGVFILLILGALIFTDWALTEEEPAPAVIQPPPPPRDPNERRVEGIKVLRPPVRAGGSGAGPRAPGP